MATENEYEEVDVNTQEEATSEEETVDTQEETQDEDTVTLSKSEYKKLQRRSIAYKANKEVKVESIPNPQSASYDVTPEKLERIELRQDGYSKEEVDAIMELGGSKSLSNPLVKNAIEVMRNKQKSENATESLSSKSPVYKKFTQADLNKMSSKELEAILPHE